MFNSSIFEIFTILRRATGAGPDSAAPMSQARLGDSGRQEPPASSPMPHVAGAPDMQPDYFRYQAKKFEESMADDAAADRAIKLAKAETEQAIVRARAAKEQAIELGWAQTKQRLVLRAGITALSVAVLILIVVVGWPAEAAIAVAIAGLLGGTAGFGLATKISRRRGAGSRGNGDAPSGQTDGAEPSP
jgi:hypothetical protein